MSQFEQFYQKSQFIKTWKTKNRLMNLSVQRPKLFLNKLKLILQNSDNCIRWNEDGDKIILENKNQFILETLPQYFRHNNYNSFLRQLNKYKFRVYKNKDQKIELYHKDFQRDNINLSLFQHNKCKGYQNYHQQLQDLRRQIFLLHLNQQHLQQQMEKITKQMSIFYKIMSLIISMYVKLYIFGWRNANSLIRFYLLFCRGIQNEFFKKQILQVFDQALDDSQLAVRLNYPKYRGFLERLNNWETEVFKLTFEPNTRLVYQIYRMSPLIVLCQKNKKEINMLGYTSDDEI
ncbi:Heat shock factor protein 4 [Paramecium bursaria]